MRLDVPPPSRAEGATARGVVGDADCDWIVANARMLWTGRAWPMPDWATPAGTFESVLGDNMRIIIKYRC